MKRNISTMICLTVFLCAGPARADGPIGLIMDGYKDGCVVKRGDGATLKCRYNLELYAGDRITKTPDASAMKIQWLAPPSTRAVTVDRTTLLIVCEGPEAKKGLIARLGDALSFMKKTPHRSAIMATRTGEGAQSCRDIIVPQPGYNATLLPGRSARFAWYGQGKAILFRGGDGKVVYRVSVQGKPEILLTPEEIGLKPGITYTWEIDGIDSDEVYQVRLIDKNLGDSVQKDLADIEGLQAVEANEKVIRKAVYLQMVSDLYPNEADLYWQSIQLLGGSGDSDGIAESLRTRYAQHLQKTVKYK